MLAPAGVVLAVTPTERHLAELREPLGLLRTEPGKADRLAGDLALRERGRVPIESELHLTAEEALPRRPHGTRRPPRPAGRRHCPPR